jgi:hypothetical protein
MKRPNRPIFRPIPFGPQSARVATLTAGALLITASIFGTGAYAAELVDIRGPDVTIIEEEDRKVLEYRQGGVLRMVRIVPNWGKPYYLVPRDQTAGHEDLERSDALLPSWVIVEF